MSHTSETDAIIALHEGSKYRRCISFTNAVSLFRFWIGSWWLMLISYYALRYNCWIWAPTFRSPTRVSLQSFSASVLQVFQTNFLHPCSRVFNETPTIPPTLPVAGKPVVPSQLQQASVQHSISRISTTTMVQCISQLCTKYEERLWRMQHMPGFSNRFSSYVTVSTCLPIIPWYYWTFSLLISFYSDNLRLESSGCLFLFIAWYKWPFPYPFLL